MSFYLGGEFINEAYLRYMLLNNGKIPTEREEVPNNGIDEDFFNLEDGSLEKKILDKLIINTADISNEQLLNYCFNAINNENIDLYSSLLTFSRHHILTILYLLYEGKIGENELKTIISSTSRKNRNELLLSFLNNENENTVVDLFKPLKSKIREMMNFINNPTELPVSKVKKLREELKDKRLKNKTQFYNKDNLFYADKGENSPFFLCNIDDVIRKDITDEKYSIDQNAHIFMHNFFNIDMFNGERITLDNKLDSINKEYSNYISKTGNGDLTLEQYKTDIINGKKVLDFIRNHKGSYTESYSTKKLHKIFADALWQTLNRLIEIDWNNRTNEYFYDNYPDLSETIKLILQENFNEAPDLEGNKLSSYIKIEDKNDVYIFNKAEEKDIDSYMKINILIDDDCKIINFGQTNILYYINKISDLVLKNSGIGSLTTGDILESIFSAPNLEERLRSAISKINPTDISVSEGEKFLIAISKKIVENYIDYLFTDDKDFSDVFKIDDRLDSGESTTDDTTDKSIFDYYEEIFKARHIVMRFYDALEAIKSTDLYNKILEDPCNCNNLFNNISKYLKYLEYNKFLQDNYNSEEPITSYDVEKMKVFTNDFGGIL